MRAAIFPSGGNTYGQYITLWSIAARAGLGLAGVFVDDGIDSPEPYRQMARREIDVVLAWRADRLSRSLLDAISATGCRLAQPPDAEFERKVIERVKAGIARDRADGKRLGRPRVAPDIEAAIRVELAIGKGIRKVARECGVGVSVVQRIKAA